MFKKRNMKVFTIVLPSMSVKIKNVHWNIWQHMDLLGSQIYCLSYVQSYLHVVRAVFEAAAHMWM